MKWEFIMHSKSKTSKSGLRFVINGETKNLNYYVKQLSVLSTTWDEQSRHNPLPYIYGSNLILLKLQKFSKSKTWICHTPRTVWKPQEWREGGQVQLLPPGIPQYSLAQQCSPSVKLPYYVVRSIMLMPVLSMYRPFLPFIFLFSHWFLIGSLQQLFA